MVVGRWAIIGSIDTRFELDFGAHGAKNLELERDGHIAQLGPSLGHALLEKGGGGPTLVEVGQPNHNALEPVGSTQISGGGSLRGATAFGKSVFTKEWMADSEILSGTTTAEAKGLHLMAYRVTLTNESLLEEASRYPSSLPRSLYSLGVRGFPSSFSGVQKALVVAGTSHDAPIGSANEEGEAAFDPLRVIWQTGE